MDFTDYLEPTFHAHATASGLGLRFRRADEGLNSYKEITEKEPARLSDSGSACT